MITKINDFLLIENIQQAKTILQKKGLNPDTEDAFKLIKSKLKDVPNLIGFFTKLKYEQSTDLNTLEHLMNWIINNRNIIGQLPKNVLQYKSAEELEDDINHLKRNTLINKFYKNLYKSMRDAVDKLNEEDKKKFNDLALTYMELDEEKKKNFTPLKYFEKNNISIQEFMDALETFIKKETVNDDKGDILEKLKEHEGNYKIKYDKNNVLVIQSNDEKTVCDIGSQNWCIVYNPDTYAKSYFGPGTYNTQYIVFNFNLPSSSANSLFGITIDENSEVKYGGSQNKRNQSVTLDEVKEMTGIPDGILIPEPSIVKMKLLIKDIVSKLIEEGITFVKLSKFIEEKTKSEPDLDIKNINTFIDQINLKSNKSHFYQVIFENTFKDKSVDEILNMFKDNFIYNSVFNTSFNDVINNIIFITTEKVESDLFSSINENKDKFYLFLVNLVNIQLSKGRFENYYTLFLQRQTTLKKIGDKNVDYETFINMLVIDENLLKKYYNKITRGKADWDTLKNETEEFLSKFKSNIINDLLSYNNDYISKDELSFNEYKTLYDKYLLPTEDEPYENIFGYFDNIYKLSEVYSSDKGFETFVIKLLNDKKEDLDIPNIIANLAESDVGGNNYYYLLGKPDYSEFLKNVIKSVDVDLTDTIKNDDILGMFLYQNVSKYSSQFKKNISIYTTEDGVDYVVVSDFHEFDDLIFEHDYFNQLDDIYTYFEWYDVDDYTLENWYDKLDDYNIISIGLEMIKKIGLKKYYSINTVNENVIDSEKIKINNKPIKLPKNELLNEYNTSENIKKLKKDLGKLIFNIHDVANEKKDETILDYEDEINVHIKQEMINRALMQAQETTQYDYIFNSLIDEIGKRLGSTVWKDQKHQRQSIYKFQQSENMTEIMFTVDVSHLIDYIDNNYSDLYYEIDSNFSWGEILTYVKNYDSSVDMSSTYDYAYMETPSNEYFNESFRNL